MFLVSISIVLYVDSFEFLHIASTVYAAPLIKFACMLVDQVPFSETLMFNFSKI